MTNNQLTPLGTVYIGSSLHNAERVKYIKRKLEFLGIICTYDWTVHGQVFDPKELLEIAIAEEQGVSEADVFLMVFPGRTGTHVEFGIARGLGKPIVLLEEVEVEQKSFYYLPGIRKAKTENEAIDHIFEILRGKHVDIPQA